MVNADMGKDGDLSIVNNNNKYVGTDEFGFSLGYYQGDYSPINTPHKFFCIVYC